MWEQTYFLVHIDAYYVDIFYQDQMSCFMVVQSLLCKLLLQSDIDKSIFLWAVLSDKTDIVLYDK